MTPDAEAGTAVEGHNGIVVLRGSGLTRGWNGIRYKTGLSARNTRAKQLSMNVATIPLLEGWRSRTSTWISR